MYLPSDFDNCSVVYIFVAIDNYLRTVWALLSKVKVCFKEFDDGNAGD